MIYPTHAPVLLDRVVELLAPALEEPGAVLVDCTLGLGGHSEAVLERIPGCRVIGIDRQSEANFLDQFNDRTRIPNPSG